MWHEEEREKVVGEIFIHSPSVVAVQEENEVTEFFVTLEKDPQQEDFLQGRMPGNPYSSNEPGIGPLMRDIKNKICQDCDLVALLEDDSGMEVSRHSFCSPAGNVMTPAMLWTCA